MLIETGEDSPVSHRNRPPMPRASSGPRLLGAGASEPFFFSKPVSRSISEPVARGISDPAAHGVGHFNQAAAHAAGGWLLKSLTSGPNNLPSMVLLAATFTCLKALADNSAELFERAVVGALRGTGGPSSPSAAA